ncbi:3'-5' exonuclease [Rhodotorula toruloides]|uniref:RNA exonuclease 4 n=1 Tax=Rhodotorula toruloides TaxID=5286 RepID=A0A0K3CA91_RHOTO|nr:Ribonuclease H-like domain-containing protein [Rhodotorula toruloides]
MAKGKAAPAPAAPSSNWKSLKAAIKPTTSTAAAVKDANKRKRRHSSVASDASSVPSVRDKGKGKAVDQAAEGDAAHGREKGKKGSAAKKLVPVDEIMKGGTAAWQQETGQYLAIDCEMVGVGPEGVESTLARVSIVNYHGCVILDRFVRPREKVTDYRTWVSGVREEDLRNAPSFTEVQKEVSALLTGRILVGHALSNDTTVLLLSHPRHMTRDTSKYAPLQGLAKTKRPGLKTLAKLVLGIDIQSGEHSSVIDARATMAIYRSQKPAWEDALLKRSTPSLLTTTTLALQSLDLSNINLTGVGKKKQQHLGLAATLRHVQNMRLEEEAAGDEEGEDMEETARVEAEKRKKRRIEEGDDLVLGFDFASTTTMSTTVVSTAPAPTTNGHGAKQAKKNKPKPRAKGAGGAKGGRGAQVDLERRPASKAGWWEED